MLSSIIKTVVLCLKNDCVTCFSWLQLLKVTQGILVFRGSWASCFATSNTVQTTKPQRDQCVFKNESILSWVAVSQQYMYFSPKGAGIYAFSDRCSQPSSNLPCNQVCRGSNGCFHSFDWLFSWFWLVDCTIGEVGSPPEAPRRSRGAEEVILYFIFFSLGAAPWKNPGSVPNLRGPNSLLQNSNSGGCLCCNHFRPRLLA